MSGNWEANTLTSEGLLPFGSFMVSSTSLNDAPGCHEEDSSKTNVLRNYVLSSHNSNLIAYDLNTSKFKYNSLKIISVLSRGFFFQNEITPVSIMEAWSC